MPTSFSQYPLSSESDLKALYVGKHLEDVPCPAAVIDLAIAKRNCNLMLEAAEKLGVGWRAHVKTHKVGFRHSNSYFVFPTLSTAQPSKLCLISNSNYSAQINVKPVISSPLVPSLETNL
jgi:hypothetical protein